jgi:hypothetical protein
VNLDIITIGLDKIDVTGRQEMQPPSSLADQAIPQGERRLNGTFILFNSGRDWPLYEDHALRMRVCAVHYL